MKLKPLFDKVVVKVPRPNFSALRRKGKAGNSRCSRRRRRRAY